MSLHTSGHVVAPKSGLFACHHASNADGEPRKNDTLNQYIDRWCSGTNQSTAWIATSQTNLLCSRKNQQHEPSHQWTCCSPQKRIVCVPPCIKCRRWTSQKRHLKPIHRWCSGTNQSTAWIATSQTNLLCSRKNQQHEPSHQWTCCSPQKRIVCVPPCIKCRRWTSQKRHLKPIHR